MSRDVPLIQSQAELGALFQRLRAEPLLAVDTSRGELLVPLAEDICTMIDVAARRIEVHLPEGLREL